MGPHGLPPILTQMSPRERGARWHHYRRAARAQSPSLTAAFPSLRRGQDGSAPRLKEWTEAQRDEVARPGSTCVRWQRGDGNAACHVPALLSLYLWKFRCRHSLPPSRSSSWTPRDQSWWGGVAGGHGAVGPRGGASWPFKPILVSLEVASGFPASSLMTCYLHPPLPPSRHQPPGNHLLSQSYFQVNFF